MAIRSAVQRNLGRRNKDRYQVPGSENVGKYNEHGEQITEPFRGEVFDTRDEALDKRYSFSSQENIYGVLDNKRKNIFGN